MDEVELELTKENIKYNEKKNRVIITLTNGTKITITIVPHQLRDILPTLDAMERIKDLEMIIHDIEREQLTLMSSYVTEMRRIARGLADARGELDSCSKIVQIKAVQVKIKSFVDEKNVLAEIRRTIGILEKQKKEYRTRKARMESGVE